MSSFNSFAARASLDSKFGRGNSANFATLVLLPLVIALAVIPAVASAFLFSTLFGGNAHAFSADAFSVNQSTTQAAAHPNLTVSLSRGGSDSEDIKNVVVDLPQGLIANPQAVASKCAASLFSSDRCSWTQDVGSVSTTATALGILPIDIGGDPYVLNPLSTDAATLGYVLRPLGSAIGLISKVYIKNNVTVPPPALGLKNSHISLPTTAKAIVGLIPVPITIEDMSLTFQARANALNTGKRFMLNPSKCGTSTATLTMTSYQNVTVTRDADVTTTGCASVPFNPTFAETFTVLNSEKYTGTTATITQSTADADQQESTIEDAKITYPQGTSLNFPLLTTLTGCTSAQFNANSCPLASQIGTASATIPALPPSFTGKIYALDPIGSTVNFGIKLTGPRGLKADIFGQASVIGSGPAQRVVARVDDAPQFEMSQFILTFTSQLIQQPESCGTQTITAELTGHSGATVTRTVNYTTVNCAPDTTITTAPASPTNDNTPSFSFTATPPSGATFECALDSGAFSACTSGAALAALADGDYLFRVRACNAIGNCDHTPAEYNLTIDTVAPSLTISSPANAEIVGTTNVSVVFDAESGSTATCQLDAGTPVACSEPSHTFNGVADGAHSITVVATDAAGNQTTVVRSFSVLAGNTGSADTEFFDSDGADDITSPRGGLKITDQTPTFEFRSSPAGAPAFECRIDAGAWGACGSPVTVDPLELGTHTFEVRAIGDLGDIPGTTDPSPATANFEVSTFEIAADVAYLDNMNNTLPNTQAAQHPDVEIDVDNNAGDPDNVSLQLPDGFWGSLGAATHCPLADVSAGTCGAASKIGTAELTALTNDNQPHTFTSDVYMTESPGGALAGLAGDFDIVVDGTDYGDLREDALFDFEPRYVREDPDIANVHDPRGVNATAPSLPSNTGVHPDLVNGPIEMHVSNVKVHLDGETGENIGKPLLTAPSLCDSFTPAGDPMQTKVAAVDKEGNSTEFVIPYLATDCASVPFAPTLTQSYSSVIKGTNTTVTASATIPDENSTIRNLVLDVPVSVQPQFAGLATSCQPSDTQLIPPACTTATTDVGTATIDTPLLSTPLVGRVYLEDSGNALPNLYIWINDDDLGLDVRLRGASETLGTPSHIRFKINAEQDGSLTDIADLPFTSLVMDLPGSATNGPILKISTACRKIDATSSGDFTGWTGATATVTQTINFDPTCPN